eukprot:5842135-Alexandrium_andersonii.AAC.1
MANSVLGNPSKQHNSIGTPPLELGSNLLGIAPLVRHCSIPLRAVPGGFEQLPALLGGFSNSPKHKHIQHGPRALARGARSDSPPERGHRQLLLI